MHQRARAREVFVLQVVYENVPLFVGIHCNVLYGECTYNIFRWNQNWTTGNMIVSESVQTGDAYKPN